MKLKNLLEKVKQNNPKADLELIKKAYEFSKKYHENQKRLSKEPYIIHPLNVAYILAELNMDTKTISAALLHDAAEDTNLTINEIKKEFGEEIAYLVDGVTKIKEFKYKDTQDIESIRKMMLASTEDIRVILIKLADKLHNMRTIKYLPDNKQKEISQGVLDIYAPLAYRLGIAKLKSELEDLAFEVLYPEMYKKFMDKFMRFGKNKVQREIEILKLKHEIEKDLKSKNIEVKVLGRPKHLYSIYKKMITKNRKFEEIHDILALRIITDNIKNCYEILGIIHNKWKPIPGEFDDYIAMPKVNMYQSLHTAIIVNDHPVEFQIRTKEMDELAEEGIAAHWKYKGLSDNKRFDKKLSWMKEILDWKRETSDPEDFMESLKVDLFGDEIYVFTPKGDVVNLPKGSCPIDFAYQIHSQVGDKCHGVIINGRISTLRQELKNGDIVSILTSKNSRPRRDWLKIVKTVKAKAKIKQYIKSYEKIPVASMKQKSPLKKDTLFSTIKIEGYENADYKLAKCCNPIPGDKIIAYFIGAKGFSIHKISCKTLNLKEKKRRVKSDWKDFTDLPLKLTVIANDRVGLLADVLNTIAAASTNINNAVAKPIGNDLFECNFNIKVDNLDHIKDIISRIQKVRNVRKVFIDDS